ncbi:MAG: UPF0489 family protein [Candidatus Levyibacteriota bacterium]|nr:MAG: UPF0489 family protein [Candidatus Levybacteria bacterium]
MNNWIIPFSKRGKSEEYGVNFLYRDKNIYISDNHRVALWCWMQRLNLTKKYSLIHIDEHFDTGSIHEWKQHTPTAEKIKQMSINEYRSYTNDLNCRIFRYDNYLSFMGECYYYLIDKFYIGHHVSSFPQENPKFIYTNLDIFSVKSLFEKINFNKDKFIFNLDLDYFIGPKAKDQKSQFKSDDINKFFTGIKKMIDKDRIIVLTIALSPDADCSGSWKDAEKFCEKYIPILGIKFKLQKLIPKKNMIMTFSTTTKK